MATLKVLQLERWMKAFDNPKDFGFDKYLHKYYKARKPVIGRDGWYLLKGVSWFEKDGKAFFETKEGRGLADSFNYSLGLMSFRSFREVDIEIIEKAIRNKIPLDKGLLEEYGYYRASRQIRGSFIEARKSLFRLRKRMTQ